MIRTFTHHSLINVHVVNHSPTNGSTPYSQALAERDFDVLITTNGTLMKSISLRLRGFETSRSSFRSTATSPLTTACVDKVLTHESRKTSNACSIYVASSACLFRL